MVSVFMVSILWIRVYSSIAYSVSVYCCLSIQEAIDQAILEYVFGETIESLPESGDGRRPTLSAG